MTRFVTKLAYGLMAAFASCWIGLTYSSAANAPSQSAAEFYRRTGLKIVVASGAGGGYDIYSRLLASRYGRHIPGSPSVIVEDMPGAAGITATNWAYNAAPRDGSQILGTYSALIDANLLHNRQTKFDVQRFNWIGSIAASPLICITWHKSPYKDIRQMIGKPLTVSAAGRDSKSATTPLLLNQILGTRFKVIPGYSTTGTTLALARGEVDAICGIGLSTLRASNPEWLRDAKVNIVAQIGLTKIEGLETVPNVLDLVTGQDRELVEFDAILEAMGRPYLAPPNVPPDRVAALRAGFDATVKDPEFVRQMTKLHLELSPMSGTEMNKWISKLYSFSPDLIQRISRIYGIERAR